MKAHEEKEVERKQGTPKGRDRNKSGRQRIEGEAEIAAEHERKKMK